jgi:hypothetical protein
MFFEEVRIMKKSVLFLLACVSALAFSGCLSLKPFTQSELDRLSATNSGSLVRY